MTGAEKSSLYQMLKKTSAALAGYESQNFAGAPDFSDDPEIVPAPAALQVQNAALSASAAVPASADSGAATRCPLCQTRKNVVPGEGVPNPLVLVVGEGPGADEDEQGRPFVGRAGQLLDKMLFAINLSRDKNCFIANIVKCRPPMNRDPAPEESQACRSFLDAQIHVLKPKMILAMGRVALQNLLDTSIGINRMRGRFVDFKGIPFMATYHPSALLRDESLKRPAWEDLKAFKGRLLEICPDYDK